MSTTSKLLSPIESIAIGVRTIHIFDNGVIRFAPLDEVIQLFNFPVETSQQLQAMASANLNDHYKVWFESECDPPSPRCGLRSSGVAVFAEVIRSYCIQPTQIKICDFLVCDLAPRLGNSNRVSPGAKPSKSVKRRAEGPVGPDGKRPGRLIETLTHPANDKQLVRIFNVNGTRVAHARDLGEKIWTQRSHIAQYPHVGWVTFQSEGKTVIGHTAAGVRSFADKAEKNAKHDLAKWFREFVAKSVSDDLSDDDGSEASAVLAELKDTASPMVTDESMPPVTEVEPFSDITPLEHYEASCLHLESTKQMEEHDIQLSSHAPVDVPAEAVNPVVVQCPIDTVPVVVVNPVAVQCPIENAVKEAPSVWPLPLSPVIPVDENSSLLLVPIVVEEEQVLNPFPVSTSLYEGAQQVATVLNGTHPLVKECCDVIQHIHGMIKRGLVSKLISSVSIKGVPSTVAELVCNLLKQRCYEVKVDAETLYLGIKIAV